MDSFFNHYGMLYHSNLHISNYWDGIYNRINENMDAGIANLFANWVYNNMVGDMDFYYWGSIPPMEGTG